VLLHDFIFIENHRACQLNCHLTNTFRSSVTRKILYGCGRRGVERPGVVQSLHEARVYETRQ
jgi:hypothetical protein